MIPLETIAKVEKAHFVKCKVNKSNMFAAGSCAGQNAIKLGPREARKYAFNMPLKYVPKSALQMHAKMLLKYLPQMPLRQTPEMLLNYVLRIMLLKHAPPGCL